MAFGLYHHHRKWTLGPDLDLSPGDQVRQQWEPQRSAVNRLGLTKDQKSRVTAAVRKATVFDAINTNIVAKYRRQRWHGVFTFVLTGAGLLAGLVASTNLDDILDGVASRLTRQRPWVDPVPAAVVWAIRIVAGAVCAWFATTHILGLTAGVCWALVVTVLSQVFATTTEALTVWRWRSQYALLPSSYIATAAMLQPAMLVATNRRSWAKPTERKALTDELRGAAAQASRRYSRIARAATRSTGDHARILSQASRVQHALPAHRHNLMDVTNQKDYNSLASEIRK